MSAYLSAHFIEKFLTYDMIGATKRPFSKGIAMGPCIIVIAIVACGLSLLFGVFFGAYQRKPKQGRPTPSHVRTHNPINVVDCQPIDSDAQSDYEWDQILRDPRERRWIDGGFEKLSEELEFTAITSHIAS